MKKDLLKMADLSRDEINELLDIAAKLKYERKNGIEHQRAVPWYDLSEIFHKNKSFL